MRNKTERKIHNFHQIDKNGAGNLSERSNIPQNNKLMKNHTINHMKEEYSARVNDLKKHLE